MWEFEFDIKSELFSTRNSLWKLNKYSLGVQYKN